MSKRVKLSKVEDETSNETYYTATIEYFQLKPYYVYRWWAIGTSNNPAIQYADLTKIEEGYAKLNDTQYTKSAFNLN